MQIRYLIILAGVVLLILVCYQILSGLGKIKFNPKHHKTVGLILAIIAVIHAIVATIYLLR